MEFDWVLGMELTAVFLAGGVSSRFGGDIKALAKIGPKEEPLLTLSMREAKEAGFENFVIIASPTTLEPLQNVFGNAYLDNPVGYCVQELPVERVKPWGTADALLAAKDLIDGPFMVLNSDDLYGTDCMKQMATYLQEHEDGYCMPGYKLKNVLPPQGKVNRGLIKHRDGDLVSVEEQFNVTMADIGTGKSNFSGEELISMNIFCMQVDFMSFLEEKVMAFKKAHVTDAKIECLLPHVITEFISSGNVVKVIPVEDTWLGLTYQEDLGSVKGELGSEKSE